MTVYRIEAKGDAREVYEVEAESLEEVYEKFVRGDLPEPVVTECSGMQIVSVEDAGS